MCVLEQDKWLRLTQNFAMRVIAYKNDLTSKRFSNEEERVRATKIIYSHVRKKVLSFKFNYPQKYIFKMAFKIIRLLLKHIVLLFNLLR